MSALKFTLDVRSPQQRRIAVRLDVETALLRPIAVDAADGGSGDVEYEFFVATWTPGSYLIREFARQFGPVRAVASAEGGASPTPLACRKVTKNRYRVRVAAAVRRLCIDYQVHAHELTVRTADVGADHAFWNHACVLLWPVGALLLDAEVAVSTPADWDCIGGLPVQRLTAGAFRYSAPDFDTLVDAPMLAGKFTRLQREVLGVTHEFALDGLGSASVDPQFLDDAHRIVEQAAAVFGVGLPYPHYTVLALFTDSGYGGLEHANSTTLLASRTALTRGKKYQEYLGLFAHELFHAWNVKRMRPAELWSYDYESENLTSMLWLAEGFTAYYDDLLCRRAGVISIDDYLALVAKNLAGLWTGFGRFQQSLAEASYDAWIRHYRPDENTRNSTQNYYGNGALVALVLDLTIRRATAGERCLDDAVAALYRETFGAGRGYRLDDVVRCLSVAARTDLGPLLHSLTAGPLDPDFASLFAAVGIVCEPIERKNPYLGFAFETGKTVVASVTEQSPAFASELAPGDEVIAIEGLRVTADRWADLVQSVAAVDRPLRLLIASRGIVRECTITPIPAPATAVQLRCAPTVDAMQDRLRRGWLGDPVSAAMPQAE